MSAAAGEAARSLLSLAKLVGVVLEPLTAPPPARVEVTSVCWNRPAHRIRQWVPVALACHELPFGCPDCEVTWVAAPSPADG